MTTGVIQIERAFDESAAHSHARFMYGCVRIAAERQNAHKAQPTAVLLAGHDGA